MHSNLQCVTCFCLRSHRRRLPPLTPPGTPPRQQLALQGCVWSQEVFLNSRARYRNEPKPGIFQISINNPRLYPALQLLITSTAAPVPHDRVLQCAAIRLGDHTPPGSVGPESHTACHPAEDRHSKKSVSRSVWQMPKLFCRDSARAPSRYRFDLPRRSPATVCL